METLELHITKARYPIRKGIQLMPPSSFYNKQRATQALNEGRKVVRIVSRLLEREVMVAGRVVKRKLVADLEGAAKEIGKKWPKNLTAVDAVRKDREK